MEERSNLDIFGEAPQHHPDVEGGDASMCPHLQMKRKRDQKMTEKATKKNEDNESESESSSEEEAAPRGGCPVMHQNGAKDPKLELFKPGYR